MRTITVLVIAFLSSSSAWAQAVPQMRTRLLIGLTNTEIEQYLKRNDVIFVPVGTVEPHGGASYRLRICGPARLCDQDGRSDRRPGFREWPISFPMPRLSVAGRCM